MDFREKTIRCLGCQAAFPFSVGEQEFFASRGLTEPKRCPACRRANKERRLEQDLGGDEPGGRLFTATCAACGGEARVPFEPRRDRPVYCSDCYREIRPDRNRR